MKALQVVRPGLSIIFFKKSQPFIKGIIRSMIPISKFGLSARYMSASLGLFMAVALALTELNVVLRLSRVF